MIRRLIVMVFIVGIGWNNDVSPKMVEMAKAYVEYINEQE